MTAAFDPGFGVYVHWPFCASKCPYCDFNSHVRASIDEARFVAAYLREIASNGARAPGQAVTSIFFGGGTPSLMQPGTVAQILDAIARQWTIAGDAEITLEANPSSVEAERFRGYRAAGINRVSLGVQSLVPADLARLGRLHTVDEAKAAIATANAVFGRVSFDLIYARPGQSIADWQSELDQALALAAGHISLYQLTIEDGTPYAALHKAGKLVVPEGELADDLYEVTQERTEKAGLAAYEISNHARPGEAARHNLLYWRYGTYAAIGAGAHGRLMVDGVRRAFSNKRSPECWLQAVEHAGHGVVEDLPLTRAEEADEMLLMGLRLREGLDLSRLARETGFAPATSAVTRLVDLGMLDVLPRGVPLAGARITATRRGRFVLNEIVRQLSTSLAPADHARTVS